MPAGQPRGAESAGSGPLRPPCAPQVSFQHEAYPAEPGPVAPGRELEEQPLSRQVFIVQELEVRDRLASSQINKFLYLHFCHKGGIICISEVTDISPGSLDSSLCFIQPSVLHDVLCIEVK